MTLKYEPVLFLLDPDLSFLLALRLALNSSGKTLELSLEFNPPPKDPCTVHVFFDSILNNNIPKK